MITPPILDNKQTSQDSVFTAASLLRASCRQVLCMAHVTNTVGVSGDDFEKSEADGTRDALAVLEHAVSALCKGIGRLSLSSDRTEAVAR
jgi:hypothetical protein